MSPLTASTLNGFSRALVTQFRQSAKGLDAESERFLKTRPYERVLCGFLTPTEYENRVGDGTAEADSVPEDDSYEQTHIGFEWSMPTEGRAGSLSLPMRVQASVYARVMPTYEEAVANTKFDRSNTATLIEVWQRFTLPAIDEVIDLDEVVSRAFIAKDLTATLLASWAKLAASEPTVFKGRRERRLSVSDLSDQSNYTRWLGELRSPAEDRSCDWRARLDVRAFASPTEPGVTRVLVRLINGSPTVDRPQAAFVDPRLYAVAMHADIPRAAHRYSEFRVLPNSYRYDRRVAAVGINCQPEVKVSDATVALALETVPVTVTPRVVPREVPEGVPDFERLADEQVGPDILRAILKAMRTYEKTEWQAKLAQLSSDAERADADAARAAFVSEIDAFSAGLETLLSNPAGPEAKAFRLMNVTMKRAGEGRKNPVRRWYLFQLVFIVSHIAKLTALARGEDVEDELNILWFPAGGGKTEAFLGLLVWHAFYDRLRGKSLGVTGFVRYPLRLLTYQQLQRTVWVLGKAEEVRADHAVGGHPFSVGYYVGESTTPNAISDDLHRQLSSAPVPASWQRVFRCPFCGTRNVGLRYVQELRLVEHYCRHTQCRTRGGRLPVYVVDADLYRYLPTIIVSTVDKLAQLGQNRRFAQLLGRIQLFCPLHGAAFKGSNRPLCSASVQAELGRPPVQCCGADVVYGPFRWLGPSMHVQDEMHLLRESLATFDSHYETSALALQQAAGESQRGWYLIGATATIEGYHEQAAHLYLKKAVRFPAPGPEAYESFYYSTDPKWLGRFYVGVLGVGRTHTPSVARTIALLYGIVDRTRLLARSDMASARSALGMPAITLEDIEQAAFLYEILLTYVLTRKGGDQVSEAIDTRVRREVEQAMGANLRLETFNSNVDMPRMIERMEEIESATLDTDIGDRVRGVVATNIISHGVDVDRFNIMVFAGLPRQFAEYIQASARVGRQVPGISVLVVTPQSERDRSVFDRFDKFHQYVDRLVEPVPINRWSEPALELTLRGILAGYLMGAAPASLGREIYLVGHVKNLYGSREAVALREDVVVQWVADAVGAYHAAAPAHFTEAVLTITRRLYGLVTGASPDRDREAINSFLNSMRSLRDIDDPAWIRVSRDADIETLKAMAI